MRRLFFSLIVIGSIAVVTLILINHFDPNAIAAREAEARYQATLRQIEIERERLDLEADRQAAQQFAPFKQALGEVIGIAVQLALLCGVVFSAVLIIHALYDQYALRRQPLVFADERGVLPVSRAHLLGNPNAGLASVASRHAIELAAAQRIDLPHSLTFSPKYSSKSEGVPLLEQGETQPPLAVPAFRELLGTLITKDGPLLLGYTAEGPLQGTFKDLLSSAIAGVQGSGKTVTQRFLIVQAAMRGARFVIVDPHFETSPEDSLAASLMPLQPAMLCKPAVEAPAILQAVKLVTARLDARLKGDPDRTPLLMVVDEFTQCMRNADVANDLAFLLERLATEGRKVQVTALLGGQSWGVQRSGGSALRNTLSSAYVHRIKRPEAQKLLQLGEETPRDTHALPTGGGYFYRTNGDLVRIQIPYTSESDVQYVAGLLGYGTTAQPTIDVAPAWLPDDQQRQPTGNQTESNAELNSSASQSPIPRDPRTERIRQLVREKKTSAEIVKAVWGDLSGRAYTKATQELAEIVAELV